MAYSEELADRVREILSTENNLEEKAMFGGLCFMVNDKMCVCVRQNEIMCRLDPENYQSLLEKSGVRQMIHGNKLMKGYVYVEEEEIRSAKSLRYWVGLTMEYNERAKAYAKEKKSKK